MSQTSRKVSPLSEELKIHFSNRNCTVRTTEPEKLCQAASYLNQRMAELRKTKPNAKSSDLETLLLLEMALEKEEQKEAGKALLKKSDELLKWLEHRIKKC